MGSDFQFDPDTGLPVSAPDQGFQFDPDTGLPVSSSAAQTQPQTPAPAAQPDWWEDYWGPLKDHASQAYHDSLAGNPASMPATDPITAKGLLDGRQALQQQIFDGSDPEADGESRQAAALAATRLAKIDHVLGMMGNQSGELATGVTKPGDIIDSLTHDKLMASDRYRQVYESAAPVLGPEKAADYAKDTVAKDAHFIPYMSDGIFADLLGAPKATAFDKNYRPSAPELPADVFTEGAAQAAAPEESFLPEAQRAGLGSLSQVAMAAAGALQPALGAVHEALPELPDASTAMFKLADYFGDKADEVKRPDSDLAQILQMPLSGLTGMLGSDVGREVIKAGGTVEQAQKATAIEAGGGEVSLLIPVLGKTLLGRLFAQSAAAPAVAEAEREARNLNTPDQAEPYSPKQSIMAILGAAPFALMGGHGEAPPVEAPKIPPAFRENFTAAVADAQKVNSPEAMDRLEYIAENLVSGDKPALWGAAELNHLTKTGQARDEAGFQQWRDERTAAQVEQPTAAETAPGEGEQTMEAAQAIVGSPNAPSTEIHPLPVPEQQLPPDEHPDSQVPTADVALPRSTLRSPIEAPSEAGKHAELDAAYAQRQQAEQRTRDEQLATAAPDLERLGLSEQDQRLEREHAAARAAGMEEEPPPTAMAAAFQTAKRMPRPEPPAPEPLVEGTVTGGEAPAATGGPTIEGFRPQAEEPSSTGFKLSDQAMAKGAEVPSKPSFRVAEPVGDNGIPTDLPVEKTDASDALERSINYHFTEPGEPQASFAEVRPDSVPHPLSEALNAAQEFTGTKISIIRDVGPAGVTPRWNGMTLREGTLYVNEGTNQPVVHILSHEWTHQLRADAPHLYQQLEDEVNRQGWVDAYAKKFGLNKADALEELTADATGDAMGDHGFLDRMAKENPTVFGRVAAAFKNFLNKFVTKYPDLGSHNYMSDVAAFRDKLADVLHQHAAERAARGEPIGEPEPAFRRAAGNVEPPAEGRTKDAIGLLYGDEEVPKLQGKSEAAKFLEERTREANGGRVLDVSDENDRTTIAKTIADEAQAAIKEKGNALEWYDSTIGKTMRMLAVKHPEIAHDPDARTAYMVAMSITSQNTHVFDNLKFADKVYSEFKRTGRFPEIGTGAKSPAMVENFRKTNQLLDELGSVKKLGEFFDKEFTVKQLSDLGYQVSGENMGTKVYGSAVLGPKIGNGFYSNLKGNFNPVTMDMWFMRTIGRLRGAVLKSSVNPDLVQGSLDRFRDAKQQPGDRLNMRKIGVKKADIVDDDKLVDAAVNLYSAHERDFQRNKDKYKSGEYEKSDQVRAAERIVKNMEGTNDTPGSGTERDHLRDIVGKAVAELKERGVDVKPASLQALIWYPEQRLYAKLGVKLPVHGEDYASATLKHLTDQGFDRAELERAAGSQSGSARPGGSEGESGAAAPAGEERGAPHEPARPAFRLAGGADEGELQDAARVRGGEGVLPVSHREAAQDGRREPDGSLLGLPRNVGGGFKPSVSPEAARVAADYMRSRGEEYSPPNAFAKVDPDRASRIAQAYDAMEHAPNDPAVKRAYGALIKETLAQYQAIKESGLKVDFIDPSKGDPYEGNPRKMIDDVRDNNHMYVFSTRDGFGSDAKFDASQNPLLGDSGEKISGQPAMHNDLFRVVHDYFGHVKEGVGFRADGEENAWRAHRAMFSPEARAAMTSETRGQNSWVNYGPHAEQNRKASGADTIYADQKIGILPDWAQNEGAGVEPPKPAFARAPAEENVAPHSAENEDGAPVKTVKSSIGNLHIETAAGQTRTGTGENGKPFSRVMKHDYGYIEGVPGRDGGSMDVLLGEGAHNPMLPVFVVHQKNNAGGFDEHKVLVGFRNQRDAERAYLSEYPKGWDKMGQVEQFSAAGFKQWARTEGREQAQLGKVDASVPRVNIRGQQPDAVAAFGATDRPMPQRTANEDGRMDLPNAVKGIASRTVFDPAEAGGKHQAVLRNLYDVKADPRGLADMARDTLEAHGLPLDLPHMMNEYERLVIAHGFDGYKTSDGKATVLGAKVPMRATEEKTSGLATARPESAAGRITERADENAGRDNAPRGEGETTNRAHGAEGDNQGANREEAGQGVRVPNEPAGAPAHQGVATERTSIKNEETEAIGGGPIERIGGKTADELEAGARRAILKNPDLGRTLAAEVAKSPRNISDHEAAVLAVDRQRIVQEYDAATKRAVEAIGANDETTAAAARVAMKLHDDDLETNRQATVHAGTEWAKSGLARQMFVEPDESFAGLLAQRKAAAGKSVLSAAERAEIKAHADEIARLKAQVATPGLAEKPPMVAKAAKVKFDDALAQFKKIQQDKLMTKECFL